MFFLKNLNGRNKIFNYFDYELFKCRAKVNEESTELFVS